MSLNPNHSLFLTLTLVCASACAKSEAAMEDAIPTPVHVRVVAEESAASAQRYSGSIEPATKIDVAFKVGGHVRSIGEVAGPDGKRHLYGEGDRVEKGAILAVVKEADYQVRLETAQSSLLEAKASARQAELDYQRSAKLLASKSVSQAETDAMSVRLDVAKARVAGAMSHVREASLALQDCTIRAPISGVIARRFVEVGSLAGAGSPAFVLVDLTSVRVVFGAPDRMVEKLALGSELAVEVPAVAEHYRAKITRIAPSADRASRVFDVETSIENPKDQLKAGMVASLVVPEGMNAPPALVLPLTAILRSKTDPRGFAVFVIEGEGDGVARSKDVVLGDILGNQVLVREGLTRGERVVSMGATLLTDGSRVRVIPSQEK